MTYFSFFLIVGLASALVWKWRSLQICEHRRVDLRQRYQIMQEEKRVLFEFLHDLGEAFTEDMDRQQLLKIILNGAQRVTEAKGGAIYLFDSAKTSLELHHLIGTFPPPIALPEAVANKIATRHEHLQTLLQHETIPLDSEGILAQVARNGQPVWLEKVEKDDRRFPLFTEESLQVRTYLAIPLVYREDKMGVLALANRHGGGSFTESDFEIVKSVADQAAFSLHSAQIYSQLAEKKKLDHDLEVAQEIQRILLPAHAPDLKDFAFAAVNLPAQRLSGDYYDFMQVDVDSWGLVIADVSGKGVPASIIMAMCRSVLRSKAPSQASPAQVLREVNRQLFPDIREDMFITMIYAVLNTRTGEFRLARAGHEAPLLCRQSGQIIETIQSSGIALGLDEGPVFDEVIQDAIIHLEPLDLVIFYTDGINEAVDDGGKEFGRENLKAAIKTAGPQGVDFVVQNIVERVRRFSSGHEQNDDITITGLQRKKI